MIDWNEVAKPPIPAPEKMLEGIREFFKVNKHGFEHGVYDTWDVEYFRVAKSPKNPLDRRTKVS